MAILHRGILKSGMNFLQKPFTPDAIPAQGARAVLDADCQR